MIRFMAVILMCPTNYDIAMLAFSKLFHVMREKDGKTRHEYPTQHNTMSERHFSLSLSKG